MVLVNLTTAIICFTSSLGYECQPILFGIHTPIGEYQLIQRLTASPGYGGDVLQFDETDNAVYAIHRVWTLNPKEKRIRRLQSADVKERQVTNGCINVAVDVYDRLVACCSSQKITIVR